MRLKVEIDDLTPDQWEQAVRLLKTEYTIPDGASRVCLTLLHEGEEWHLETPVSAFTSLMWGMSLAPAFKALAAPVKLAMAALTPDDDRLPASPDQCKCGFRAPELGPHPMCPAHPRFEDRISSVPLRGRDA